MSDLIDRQAAIDAVYRYISQFDAIDDNFLDDLKEAINIVKTLPTAQPTQSNADSTQCNTLDCVSRQAAIDIVRNRVKRFTTACVLAVTEIEQLPSAQPEEVIPHRNYKYLSDYWCECGWHLGKKGEVIYCSECGRKVNWDE